MYTTLFAITALAGFTSAQSTTSLFLGLAGTDQILFASPIASDKTATTYKIVCPPSTKTLEKEDCAYPQGLTLTHGPTSMGFTMTEAVVLSSTTHTLFSAEVHCSLGSLSAICTASVAGEAANSPGLATETVTGKDYAPQRLTLTNVMPAANTAVPTVSDHDEVDDYLTSTANATPSSTSSTSLISSTLSTLSTHSTASRTASITPKVTRAPFGNRNATTILQSTRTPSVPIPISSSSQAGGKAMVTPKPEWIVGGAAVAWWAMM